MSEFGGGSDVGSSEVSEVNESSESTSSVETGGEISDASMDSIENDASSTEGFDSGAETPDMEMEEDTSNSENDLSEMSGSDDDSFEADPDLNYEDDMNDADIDGSEDPGMTYEYANDDYEYTDNISGEPDLEYVDEDESEMTEDENDSFSPLDEENIDNSLDANVDNDIENDDHNDYEETIDDTQNTDDIDDELDDDSGDIKEQYDGYESLDESEYTEGQDDISDDLDNADFEGKYENDEDAREDGDSTEPSEDTSDLDNDVKADDVADDNEVSQSDDINETDSIENSEDSYDDDSFEEDEYEDDWRDDIDSENAGDIEEEYDDATFDEEAEDENTDINEDLDGSGSLGLDDSENSNIEDENSTEGLYDIDADINEDSQFAEDDTSESENSEETSGEDSAENKSELLDQDNDGDSDIDEVEGEPDDYAEYTKDPEWQSLNNDLQTESDNKNEMGEETYRREIAEKGYATIPASEIQGVDSSGDHFWEHHSSHKEDFTEIASKLPDVQKELDNGATIDEIRENPALRATVDAYYDPDNMVVVEKSEDGFHFQDNGRHRVAAAQELGYDVPVKVVEVSQGQSNNEMPEKFSNNPEETQYQGTDDYDRYLNEEDVGDSESFIDLEEEIANSDNRDIMENYSANTELNDSLNERTEIIPAEAEKGSLFGNVSYRQGQNDFGAYGTCGPTSIANSLNRVTETSNYTENGVLHNAMDNNLCSRSRNPMTMGGTTAKDVVSIIDNVKDPESNIHTEVYDYDKSLSVDELADRLDGSGSVAIVGVDSATLWDRRGDVSSSGLFQRHESPSDHWITVDSPVRDENGKVTGFNIIDSGGGESFVDRDKFERMYQGDNNHRVSDPTAILVSNKSDAANTYDQPEGVKRASNYKGSADVSDGGSPQKEAYEKYADFASFKVRQEQIGLNPDMTNQEKIDAIKIAYNNTEDKRDINIPKDEHYIKGFDDSGAVEYDWPPKLGFKEETIQPISKEAPLPEFWDRYGYMGGKNFADIPESGAYTYEERSIPYVENPDAYHKGSFNNESYFDKIDAIRSGDIGQLNRILDSEGVDVVDGKYFSGLQEQYEDYLADVDEALGKDYEAPYGLQGDAAQWKDMSGGANQFVTPFGGNVLSRLGICREDI